MIPIRPAALALLAVVVIGCAPSASTPTPTDSASPSATPLPATASPTPTPSAPARLQVSGAPLAAAAGAYLLFQLQGGETRLRAISFGAEVNGVLAAQVAADAVWSSQSPYGDRYLIGSTVYHRDGTVVGALPWNAKQTVTWSSQGRFLCAIVPESTTAGARMRMEIALPGEAAKLLAWDRQPRELPKPISLSRQPLLVGAQDIPPP